ncbi:hypothetical protein M0R45_030871 [Rubus argutus]|uniref:Uncharacterized protein n=1 Tax=Rubus argutus TaxID=59490 RepID=A0AAW1WEX3_RUBAR
MVLKKTTTSAVARGGEAARATGLNGGDKPQRRRWVAGDKSVGAVEVVKLTRYHRSTVRRRSPLPSPSSLALAVIQLGLHHDAAAPFSRPVLDPLPARRSSPSPPRGLYISRSSNLHRSHLQLSLPLYPVLPCCCRHPAIYRRCRRTSQPSPLSSLQSPSSTIRRRAQRRHRLSAPPSSPSSVFLPVGNPLWRNRAFSQLQ